MAEYIEREALMKNFCGFDLTECVKYGNRTKEQAQRSFETLMMYEIADVIEDAPAADVAPVVHGRWIKCGYGTKCSRCGHRNRQDPMSDRKTQFYCYHCGAKMDKEG